MNYQNYYLEDMMRSKVCKLLKKEIFGSRGLLEKTKKETYGDKYERGVDWGNLIRGTLKSKYRAFKKQWKSIPSNKRNILMISNMFKHLI